MVATLIFILYGGTFNFCFSNWNIDYGILGKLSGSDFLSEDGRLSVSLLNVQFINLI